MENHENFLIESSHHTTKEGNDNDDNRRQINSSKLSDFFRTFQHHESLSMLYIDEVWNKEKIMLKNDKQHENIKFSYYFPFFIW